MAKVLQLAAALIIAYVVIQWLPPLANPFAPSPRPGPVDPVDPSDPEPDFSQYEEKIYREVMKVRSRTRKADCEKLSAGIQSVIDRIDTGELATNEAVVSALTPELKRMPMAWYPQIRKLLNEVFQPLTKDKTLSTPQRWAKLLAVGKRAIDRAGAESTGVEEAGTEGEDGK